MISSVSKMLVIVICMLALNSTGRAQRESFSSKLNEGKGTVHCNSTN